MAEDNTKSIVLIETLSNQSFIFASNKLREIIGASELVFRAGTRLVLQHTLLNFYEDWPDQYDEANLIDSPGVIAERLADEKYNPPLSEDNLYHVIIAASGKALILCQNANLGIELVSRVTSCAARAYPGLEVMGAVVEFNFDDGASVDCAIGQVHKRLDSLRGRFPPARTDLARFPFADDCASTGTAAAGFDVCDPDFRSGFPHIARSAAVLAKRAATQDGINRLNLMFEGCRIDFAGIGNALPEEGEDESKVIWTGAIHADGNGIGQVFLSFSNYLETTENSYDETAMEFVRAYRGFSAALDEITRSAAVRAFKATWPDCCDDYDGDLGTAIFRPVVIAGDDLTVLTDGEHALPFGLYFAQFFEEESRSNAAIQYVMGDTKVTVGVGVAVFKEHAPFHRSYGMAEQLCSSAKACKDAIDENGNSLIISGIDFHVSYNGGFNLAEARSHVGRTHDIHGGPYVLYSKGIVTTENQQLRPWNDLADIANLLHRKDKSGNNRKVPLPSGQQHVLREAANSGPLAASTQISLIKARYERDNLWETLTPGGDLFSQQNDEGKQPPSTAFADALIVNDICIKKPVPHIPDTAPAGGEGTDQ